MTGVQSVAHNGSCVLGISALLHYSPGNRGERVPRYRWRVTTDTHRPGRGAAASITVIKLHPLLHHCSSTPTPPGRSSAGSEAGAGPVQATEATSRKRARRALAIAGAMAWNRLRHQLVITTHALQGENVWRPWSALRSPQRRHLAGLGLVGSVSVVSLGLLLMGRGALRRHQLPLDRWSAPQLVRRIARYSPDPSQRRQARLVLAARTTSPQERLDWLAGQGWGKQRGQRTEPSLVLSLAASAEQQRGRFNAADGHWQTLLQQFPDTPASAEARYWLGQPGDALHQELLHLFPAHPVSLASAISSAQASGPESINAAVHLARWGPRRVGAETLLAQLCFSQGSTLAEPTATVLATALEQVDNPDAAAACRGNRPNPDTAVHNSWWDSLRQLLLQGNWQQAQAALATQDHPGQTLSEAARVRFWHGFVADRLGDRDRAHQLWRSTAALSPWSYYGWRSRVRLGNVQWPTPLAQLPTTPTAPLGPRERHDAVAWLWNLGFEQYAWEYWRHWRSGSQPKEPDALWVEGQLRIAVDDPWMGLMQLDHASWQGAAEDGARQALETLRHPLLFPHVLEPAARQQQLDPALLLAVARQESRFRPAQRSLTGALGLLQIMPATGAELLTIHGDDVLPTGAEAAAIHAADPAWLETQLLDARINAELGARYLAWLLQYWRHPILAIASYNAGPGAVAQWNHEDVAVDPELWIEAIPYPETRNYVKRVLGSWWAYSLLHAARDQGSGFTTGHTVQARAAP